MLNEYSKEFGILLPSVSVIPMSVITQLELLINSQDKSLEDLKGKIVIGSSSKRRELQFKAHLKKAKYKNIRGNIDTRISKVKEGKYDGTILALAGIQTLKLENEIIDTLVLARNKFPGSSVSLDALCKRYGVDNSRRKNHTALMDCDLLSVNITEKRRTIKVKEKS